MPLAIQEKAKKTFKLWVVNSNHPSLHFKRIHSVEPIYSVRIDIQCSALGIKDKDTVVWFWIRTHEEYNNLISEL